MSYNYRENIKAIATAAAEKAATWNNTGAYDYRVNMHADILQYIVDEIDPAEYADADTLAEYLNDELWIADNVTGNASGSYTFNSRRAREYVIDNMDLLAECMQEYGCDADNVGNHFLAGDWEYFDVSIRCYLLGECIAAALDDLDGVINYGAADEEEA